MNIWNVLPVVMVIALFGLLAIGAIAAFVIAIMQQRRYDNTKLPALDELMNPHANGTDGETEESEGSLFETPDEPLVLEDEETNELMKAIHKLDGADSKSQQKTTKNSFFTSKRNKPQAKEGD